METVISQGSRQDTVTFRVVDRSGMLRTQGVTEDAARACIARLLGDVMLCTGAPFTLERVTFTSFRHVEPVEVMDAEDDQGSLFT